MRDWPSIPIRRYRHAVFLDRDGTINVDTHYPHRVEDLCFVPRSLDGLLYLALLPVHIIVVSNQAGIAQGRYTRVQMSQFNTELRCKVEQAGGRIDAFYFCPHLEPKDLPPGTLPCPCSKPAPGMLLEAAKDFELNLARSFTIGDKISDIAAGESVSCVTVLINASKAEKEEGKLSIQPKHFAGNLLEAALIVKSYLVRS